ncbi:MAG TPA: hypothetical protein VLG74_06520 [Blastocatellia bacterium]|nr:hypothetical protein [Blastocatellia bacterium]
MSETNTGKGMYQKLLIFSGAILTVVFLAGDAPSLSLGGVSGDQARPAGQVARATADFVKAAERNKASVQGLIPHYEAALRTSTEAREKRKVLFAQGLISKLELDAADKAVKDAQTQLDQARQQLREADHLIAEASAESTGPASASGSKSTRGYTTKAAVMRYSGTGGWAISAASKVKDFFASKFGRQLPISALGQSSTHNRLGFDHRNSVDVSVHPDSAEGKALIEYLRNNGIPFLAFRSAIRGVATGAHIHIGYPSNKI